MSGFHWIARRTILAVHAAQIAEHGGIAGIRDESLLASALARPEYKAHDGEDDPAVLAAAYAYGIARNHPFVDGNKRTAWVLARLFLALGGRTLSFTADEAIEAMLALAAGELTEEELADWFRMHLAER